MRCGAEQCYLLERKLVLDGLDVLVFTGGIGEHAAPIRARVCRDAQWQWVQLNAEANRAGGPKISAADSSVSVWMIPTDEDLMIARHTYNIVSAAETNNTYELPR